MAVLIAKQHPDGCCQNNGIVPVPRSLKSVSGAPRKRRLILMEDDDEEGYGNLTVGCQGSVNESNQNETSSGVPITPVRLLFDPNITESSPQKTRSLAKEVMESQNIEGVSPGSSPVVRCNDLKKRRRLVSSSGLANSNEGDDKDGFRPLEFLLKTEGAVKKRRSYRDVKSFHGKRYQGEVSGNSKKKMICKPEVILIESGSEEEWKENMKKTRSVVAGTCTLKKQMKHMGVQRLSRGMPKSERIDDCKVTRKSEIEEEWDESEEKKQVGNVNSLNPRKRCRRAASNQRISRQSPRKKTDHLKVMRKVSGSDSEEERGASMEKNQIENGDNSRPLRKCRAASSKFVESDFILCDWVDNEEDMASILDMSMWEDGLTNEQKEQKSVPRTLKSNGFLNQKMSDSSTRQSSSTSSSSSGSSSLTSDLYKERKHKRMFVTKNMKVYTVYFFIFPLQFFQYISPRNQA